MGGDIASSLSDRQVSRDLAVEACIFAVTAVSLGVALAMFLTTPLHDSLSTWAESTLRPMPYAAYAICAALLLLAVIAGILLRNVLRPVLFLSWALYLPSILAFSRFDLVGEWTGTGLASLGGRLPPLAVLAAGLLLVCTTLAQGAVEEHRALRKSYIERGADREEVDAAVRGSLKYVALALAGSSVLAALVAIVTTVLAYFASDLSWPGSYWYLVLAVAGGAVAALVMVVLIRERQHQLP